MKIKTNGRHKLRPSKIAYPNVSVEPNTRYRVLFLLRNKKFKADTVNSLSKMLGKSASDISEHLKKLQHEGVVEWEQVGRSKVFHLIKKKKF
jgi:predicted ArsR family transcriptional regulator